MYRLAATPALFAALVIVLVACNDTDAPTDVATDPPEETVEPEDPEVDPDPDGEPADDVEGVDSDVDEADDQDDPETEDADAASPAPDLTAITLTTEVLATANQPIDAATAPNGAEVWLAERVGTVRPLSADGDLAEPVLDLSDETTTDGERGLLGIAFDPQGARFYASFTDSAGDTQVDEWTVDGDGLDDGSRRTVFTASQPFGNHNGGSIAFGPDGYLYLGLGDGGGGGDPIEAGQDWSTVLGTMVRIDPTGGDPYAVPDDNPFADGDGGAPEAWARGLRNPWRFDFDPETGTLWIADVGQDLSTALGAMVRIDPQGGDPYAVPADNLFVGRDGVAEEIWAYGLRNPWRFSFDRQTGDLWIGDVGQGTREEIDLVPSGQGAGANFGWNLMEGDEPFDGGSEPDDHSPPVHTYRIDGEARCAITGGVVYRGSAIPELSGAYIYSDFCDGVVRGLTMRDGQVMEADVDLGARGESIVGFARDAEGEVLVMDLAGQVSRLILD